MKCMSAFYFCFYVYAMFCFEGKGLWHEPAQHHLGMDCIRRLCASLPNPCRSERVSRWPVRELSERYARLKPMQPKRKRSRRGQSPQMAGIDFLYAKARYRSLEMSVSDEALAILVFHTYQSYQDGGHSASGRVLSTGKAPHCFGVQDH